MLCYTSPVSYFITDLYNLITCYPYLSFIGTIRRYGIVADAIIMIGGLSGELKSGGVKIGGNSNTNGK